MDSGRNRAGLTFAAVRPVLQPAVTGLPRGAAAPFTVTGPGGYRRVGRFGSLTLPFAGDFRVTASAVRFGAFLLRPTRAAVVVHANAGAVLRPAFAFARIAPVTASPRYPMGVFTGTDLWVDPLHGSDSASGATRSSALRSIAEAWRRIPSSAALTRGVRVNLVRGIYGPDLLPSYWEHRWGTAAAPVILRAVDGDHTARLTGDINAFDVRHLYLVGVDIVRSGDAFHCERCSHVVLRRVRMSGLGAAQETVKVNQSDHLYIEDSVIDGAWDNDIDLVAVTTGRIIGNRIHGAGDWCAYAKGGSAYISVVDNEIYGCGTGGFTAGQGTGLEFMNAPYLQYEAYSIIVRGNLIHDTEGAGIGVNGGTSIVIERNTLYRVGARSHAVEFVQGSRSCDGDTVACAARITAGGWGTTDGGGQWIPNHGVAFSANLLANPPGFSSQWSYFDVHPPIDPPAGSNVPSPARADDGLVISGNVLLNGDGALDLGFYDGACGDAHPGCAPAFVRAHNTLGPSTRVFLDPARGDYRLLPGIVPAGVGAARVA